MTSLLYLFGAPGSGKSTLIAELTKGHKWFENKEDGLYTVEFPQAGVTEIGRRREAFSGTDALGMTAIEPATRFVAQEPYSDVMAEGDRLAVARFFEAAQKQYALEPVYLDTPEDIAAQRRAARGSDQNETWIAGRVTKARKLAEAYPPLAVLDGSKPVEELVRILKGVSAVAGRFA